MITGGLVVTHGDFGKILVEETIRIVGDNTRLLSLATSSLSATDITEKVKAIIKDEPWIIFSDCPGTAPTLRSYAAIYGNQTVISGVNLAMLMSFVFNREKYSYNGLVEKMILDGKRSMEVLWPREK